MQYRSARGGWARVRFSLWGCTRWLRVGERLLFYGTTAKETLSLRERRSSGQIDRLSSRKSLLALECPSHGLFQDGY